MPSELRNRLDRWYDVEPAARVMQGSNNWPGSSFGRAMLPTEVRCLVVHQTAGFPSRSATETFVSRYINPAADRRGVGTQFYIADDGTTAKLIELPLVTWHIPSRSAWSVGVELGNPFDGRIGHPNNPNTPVWWHAPPYPNRPGPAPGPGWGMERWVGASGDANDLPGRKLWLGRNPNDSWPEVFACWWTTSEYEGPGRGSAGGTGAAAGEGQMLFSEEQYRSLALLTRYALERLGLPRNFPLLPHATWSNLYAGTGSWDTFRHLVLGDERAFMIMRRLADPAVLDPPIAATSAAPGDIDDVLEQQYEENAPGLQAAYEAGANLNTRRNRAMDELLGLYRGVHGHGFGQHNRVNCPGPVFDFHRLAREVWDWWWYPFDVDGAGEEGTSGATVEIGGRSYRGYRHFDDSTLLLEYYWDEKDSERARADLEVPGLVEGEWSVSASPATFELEPETPVYALANGELVAARLPTESPEVSAAFALVRHQVHHHVPRVPGASTPETFSFEVPPSVVYSLYMHLGVPHEVSFDEPADHNPDWLNRVLLRKRECDLGVAFHDHHQPADGFPQARWEDEPPSGQESPPRASTLEGWRTDRELLGSFLDDLRDGRTAVAPRHQLGQSVNVLLGDFLGDSGALGRRDGGARHGVRVETFSPSFSPPAFAHSATDGWDPSADEPASLSYPSEWSGTDWWQAVAFHDLLSALVIRRRDRIPVSGRVFHFHPFRFLAWINGETWRHEWTKYHVQGPEGEDVERPDRPRTRRPPPIDHGV